jgi:4'-phosphopantetheinyl transferase
MAITVHPVILPVPDEYRTLALKEKPRYLSRYAREALRLSAQRIGISFMPDNLPKNELGAPLPINGWHWSLTHKPDYVGAVISPAPIGIDIEKIRSISDMMFRKTASEQECLLGGGKTEALFFRFWTAKEAALKASGKGLTDLSKCVVSEIRDDYNLVIDYAEQQWFIEQIYVGEHIVSVTRNDLRIKWQIGSLPVTLP